MKKHCRKIVQGIIMEFYQKKSWQDSLDHCPMPINVDQCRSKSWHWSEMSLNADHCRSMPINSSQFFSIPINADQCQSMPDQSISKTLVDFLELFMTNADQCRSMLININWYRCWSIQINADHCWSLPINTDQCRSMSINAGSILLDLALIGIERNWSTLGSMPEFWSALIGIWHWSGESCHYE